MNRINTYIAALAVAVADMAAAQPAPPSDTPAIAGVWVVNRALSPAWAGHEEDLPRAPEEIGRPVSRAPWDAGRGNGAAKRRSSGGDLRKARIARDRLTDIVERFSVAIDARMVTIVDGIGRVTKLRADGKKQDRLTGDGEFTSTTRFDGDRLVVEEDFGGLKVTTTYDPYLDDGRRQVRVTVRADGLTRFRFGQPSGHQQLPPRVAIYDADPSIPVTVR